MGDETNKCDKHGQQIRSLEKRVNGHDTKIDKISIELAENTTVTKHLDETMTTFRDTMHHMDKTLVKIDTNLDGLNKSICDTNKKVEDLEKNTNKQIGELNNKIDSESAKSKIDIRLIGKNLLLYFLTPATIIGTIVTIVLAATGQL